ncbi:hypothetical protein CBS101457_001137 [Exobasidium rhododendri]|nr:hypothetical protein CBS101457_001137 [Exobasidium rhododendri]
MTIPPLPELPSELLSQIFLEVDPHTLYTSVRCLSRQWKYQVEDNLLREEFNTGRWRVGLRITRKPKVGRAWRGGLVGQEGDQVPGASWHRLQSRIESENDSHEDTAEALRLAQDAYTSAILSREGTLEDELPSCIGQDAMAPVVHIIPLRYRGYDGASTTLQFDTGSASWHALFEGSEDEDDGGSARLDLDFSIVWRFPGDGQNEEAQDGWGMPDQENGWLSRFYCSHHDTTRVTAQYGVEQEQRLFSTPLARRRRKRHVTLQHESSHPEIDQSPSRRLEWSDEGHEYFSLSLSLGAEFFVRRSARANFLMRKLEAQAEADDEKQDSEGDEQERSEASSQHYTARDATNHLNASLSSQRSTANPLLRLQGINAREYSSSASGSSRIRDLKSPFTYAKVASTPVSGTSSPNGSVISMRSREPRIARVTQTREGTGSRAPLSSANISGYSSVKHQSQSSEKDKELERAELSNVLDSTSITPSRLGHVSHLRESESLSGHRTAPRARFSAHLFRSVWGKPAPHWCVTNAESPSQSPYRTTPSLPVATPMTVWEWSR